MEIKQNEELEKKIANAEKERQNEETEKSSSKEGIINHEPDLTSQVLIRFVE